MKKPYIIAEIGVNFYDTAKMEKITPIEAAKKYIAAAKEMGVHAVKFQSYKADTIVSKNSPAYWDLSKEASKSQYELFRRHDGFGKEEFIVLKEYAKSLNIDFMSTPFDYESADYLTDLIDIYKISSSDITNLPFLKYIAQKGKPVYLSTGASCLEEIDKAVRIIEEVGVSDICLMHCVLSYPTKVEDANLALIRTLKRTFPQYRIGYSDHVPPDVCMQIVTTAYLYGAEVIEKHFTLDKTLVGNDHYHAGDPEDFKTFICNLKLIHLAEGIEKKQVLECEREARKQARRSLVLAKDKKKDELIEDGDIVIKRPGIGMSPEFLEIVIGRTLKKDVKEDELLAWDML